MDNSISIKQWFPWNGSKRWLIPHLAPIINTWAGRGIYIDPFVGGGSVSVLVRNMFPCVRQYVADANPWLMAAFKVQLLENCKIADNHMDIDYWRNLKDSDCDNLS